jgi:hypothetical protein
MKRAFVWMFLVSTTGCIRTYVVNMDEQPGGITGHYVVTQTRMNGNMKVYDCLSKPDGERWNPTCVRADLLLEAPAPK